MTIIWPEALRRILAEGAHYRRRLKRMESIAVFGPGRLNWERWPESRAYVDGMTKSFDLVEQILEESKVTTTPSLDMAVILLAQNGIEPEAIANRCGVSAEEVTRSLWLYVWLAAQPEEGGDAE